MKDNILILGGFGFIGFGIAKYLSSNITNNITIIDNIKSEEMDPEFAELIQKNNIEYICADLSEINIYNNLPNNKFKYVYLLASIVGVNNCIQDPTKVIEVNTKIILNTLDWTIKNNIKKILFTSSSECYVASTEIFDYPVPTGEEVPLSIPDIGHPRFTYAMTKMFGESAILNYSKVYNFDATIIRYQNIFGPRMGFKHAIPHIIERFYFGEMDFKIYGADQTRAFCYVSDAVIGTVWAMESSSSNSQIYHIGNTDEITISELTKYIGSSMGYNGNYIKAETYPGSVSRRCPDIAKAKKDLNFIPKIDWKDGIDKTIDWYTQYFKINKSVKDGGFVPPNKLTL